MFLDFFKSYMNEFADFVNERQDEFGVTVAVNEVGLARCYGKCVLCEISMSESRPMSNIRPMFKEFLKSKGNINASGRFFLWSYENLHKREEMTFYVEMEDNDWEALNMSKDAAIISDVANIM